MCIRCVIFVCAVAPGLFAQNESDVSRILARLDRLETQNRDLLAEIHALREEMRAHGSSPLEERVAVAESRIDEQAQTKVEATQRMPVQITGMLLFNAFANGRNGSSQYPTVANAAKGAATDGASVRQTLIGLRFHGPEVFGGGKVSGIVMMDLFEQSAQFSQFVRLRTASLNIDWKTRSLVVGQDKPIIAPRDPDSLAQVGVSPLTGTGNLWLWQPQIRFEQRIAMGEKMGLRLQTGVYQTAEGAARVPAIYASTLGRSRPALEGRFEFWRKFEGDRRIEIAPGFHVSQTHVAGVSVPSRAFSLDWLVQPVEKIAFTGAFYKGENLAGLGTIRQGFTIFGPENAIPVHSAGGWGQLAYIATKRLTFNAFAGQHDDRARDLTPDGIDRNRQYGANAIFRLAPNVLFSLEASQLRTRYLGVGNRLNNHYDLALAYLF